MYDQNRAAGRISVTRRVRSGLTALSAALIQATEVVMSILIATMVTIVFVQVVYRYFLNMPLHWTEEAARYLMIWGGLLGAALGVERGSHITVRALLNRLTPKHRERVIFAGYLATAIFLVGFLAASINLLLAAVGEETPALRIPFVLVYSAAPVSAILMIVFTLASLLGTGSSAFDVSPHDSSEGSRGGLS